MSTLDLDVIEQRARMATDGPWETFEGDEPQDHDGPYPVWRGVIPSAPGSEPVVERCKGVGYADSILNADFIATARSDVPALCAEVRRLRMTPESLSAIRDALGRFLADADYMGLSKDEAQDYRDALKSVEALS